MALPFDVADNQWMRLIERESQLAALHLSHHLLIKDGRLPSVVDHALLRSLANFRPKEEPCRSTWMSTVSMVQ